jgi:hypothetical protein
MTIALESMAVEMPRVTGHPNRRAFRGVLTKVDIPSQRPPSGSKGRRVVLTRRAAEAALPSLLGMALDYSPTWDRHDSRRKVGVITQAEIVGRDLELGGYLFAKDFPEIVEEIKKSNHDHRKLSLQTSRVAPIPGRAMPAAIRLCVSASWTEARRLKESLQAAANQLLSLSATLKHGQKKPELLATTIRAEASSACGPAGLGLSYEVANVIVADTRADVWRLEEVMFTGAAILRRNKAAYQDTWIELGSE